MSVSQIYAFRVYEGEYCTKCKTETRWDGEQKSERTSIAHSEMLCPRCRNPYDRQIILSKKSWPELIDLLPEPAQVWANEWTRFSAIKNQRSFDNKIFSRWLVEFCAFLANNREYQEIFDRVIRHFIAAQVGGGPLKSFDPILDPDLFQIVDEILVKQFPEYESVVASVSECPIHILEAYCQSSLIETQMELAANENTPKAHLEKLCSTNDLEITKALIGNSSTPSSFLWQQLELEIPIGHFAGEWDITSFHLASQSLARSSEVSTKSLERLLEDPRHGAQKLHFYFALARRQETDEAFFRFIWESHLKDFENRADWVFMHTLKGNSGTPVELMLEIDNSIHQRWLEDKAKRGDGAPRQD